MTEGEIPEEGTEEADLAEGTVAAEPERKARSRRTPSMAAVLALAIGWILLLAAGTIYLGTTKSGRTDLGRLFARWGSLRPGSGPVAPTYDLRDVEWRVEEGADGGSLFVIQGSVANVGKTPGTGIRIQATLLGKDNEALAEQAVFAGNRIDAASLRRMDRAGIEAVLSNRWGEGNVNREIRSGQALPFMVIFTDTPAKVESFMVKATDVE